MTLHPERIIDPEKFPIWQAPDSSRTSQYLVDRQTCGAKDISAGLFRLKPGHKTVPDIHPVSEELYYVVSGQGDLTLDNDVFKIAQGMIIYIPAGVTHQSVNTGKEDLCYFFAFTPPPKEVGPQKDFIRIDPGTNKV
jgi:mannose-6-phosphate isomerase-like protein (cupin superfamily)